MKDNWNFRKHCRDLKSNSHHYFGYGRCYKCKTQIGDGISYHVADSRQCRKHKRNMKKIPLIDTSILYDEIEEPEPEIVLILPELNLEDPNEL